MTPVGRCSLDVLGHAGRARVAGPGAARGDRAAHRRRRGRGARERGLRGGDRLLPRAPHRGPRHGRGRAICATAAPRRSAGTLALDELDHATAREAMLAALRFRAFPDAQPLLRELQGARRPRGRGRATGTRRCRRRSSAPGSRPTWTARCRRRWSAPPSPTRPSSTPALELAGCEPGRGVPRRRLAATATSRARAPPASAWRCSTGTACCPIRRRACRRSRRWTSSRP